MNLFYGIMMFFNVIIGVVVYILFYFNMVEVVINNLLEGLFCWVVNVMVVVLFFIFYIFLMFIIFEIVGNFKVFYL